MSTVIKQALWLRQIRCISCEPFNCDGMLNIFTSFKAKASLLAVAEHLTAGKAKDVFHSFAMGVYFSLCEEVFL